MSDLSRHIPLIALTVLFGVSIYYIYKSMTAVSHRVENLSQELYYGLNSVTELAARIEGTSPSLKPTVPPAVPSQSTSAVINPDDVLVSGIIPDDAKSVGSADIVVSGGKATPEKPPADKTKKSKQDRKPAQVPQSSQAPQTSSEPQDTQEDAMADVNAYIGNLEEKFVNRQGPDANNDDDDAASIGSEVSSVSALNGKKRVPPYAAKMFDVGHRQAHQGKMFEVIKTKSGSVRWSGAKPMTKEEESSYQATEEA